MQVRLWHHGGMLWTTHRLSKKKEHLVVIGRIEKGNQRVERRLQSCLCSVAQLYLILCGPMDCSPPGFSIYGIFQARILEWVAILYFGGSSQPRDRTCVSCIAGRFFTTEPSGKPLKIISSVQSLSRVRLFATPWIAARQASLSITDSRSSLRLRSIERKKWKEGNIVLHYDILFRDQHFWETI